jgi:iron complex transport system ATP-binding protein
MNLRAEGLEFSYDAHRSVLRGVTLELRPGVVTALFGPNGCGKSTLVRCLNGALKPRAGQVLFGDRPLEGRAASEIARHVAVVPQDTPTEVPFTVREMVRLGRYAHGDLWGCETAEDVAVVEESLSRVNAIELGERFFGTLSGGERQRVIVARALAQRGEVLLLDEPSAHLDVSHQLELYRLVRRLAAGGQAVLMVCHDLFLAPLFADECVLMHEGRMVAQGQADEALCSANLFAVYGERIEIAWAAGHAVKVAFA